MKPATADNTNEHSRADGAANSDLRWVGQPWSVAPVPAALRRAVAGRRPHWVDERGTRGRCHLGFLAREIPRYLLFRALDGITRLAFCLLPSPATTELGRPRTGPAAFVVSVLPDLSHTFIYREMLALLRSSPGSCAVSLSHGTGAPVHPEARALGQLALEVPRRGIVARYLSIWGWILRAPRRVGRLVALYRDRPGGSSGDLLGKGPLREAVHPGAGFALADALRSESIGHLHVYGSTYPANVAMEAACLLDLPFSISSYVDFDFDYDFKMLERKHQLARFFRVCTGFCRTRLTEILGLAAGDDSVPVLLYGLDLERWPRRTDPEPGAVLLTAARLVAKKGLHLVPPALARLRERGVSAQWLVAGDGPELPRLKELVAELDLGDSVTFMGPVGNDVVRCELERADLALLPCVVAPDGERDGIPIFLTEAMAMGVPVMTTPVSGIPEVVRDGDTGFLAEPGSSDQLADRLATALADPGARQAIGDRGRREIHATHDVEQSAGALLQLVEDLSRP